MPRTPIPVAFTSTAGVSTDPPLTADPVNGHTVPNPDGRTALLVANTGLVSRTMTIRVAATVDGLPVSPRTVTIAAGTAKLLGGYQPDLYGATLLIDPDSTDLTFVALRHDNIFVASGGAFSFAAPVTLAQLAYPGLSLSGSVLIVDTAVTGSTVAGNVLIVNV